jgi:hypothetical protein
VKRTFPSSLILLLFVAGLIALAPPLFAQDLNGSWAMETNAGLPEENTPCVYSGDCQMQQTGGEVTGTVDLVLVSGPEGCPAEMTATVEGSLDGEEIFGTLFSPVFGQASVSGAPTNSWAGTFTVEQGDFTGSSGDWLAQRLTVLEIPTLTALGLTLLVLALLLGGAWVLRTDRRTA